MIELNLLPQSYFKAKRKKQAIGIVISAGFLAAVVMVGLYFYVLLRITELSGEIKAVELEQKKYKDILNETDNIKKTKAFVEERLGVIEQLKEKQVLWMLLLDNFNQAIPTNIWLNSFTNKSEAGGFRTFAVDGVSLFKESVADFLSNLNKPDGLFREAKLVSMTETNVSGKSAYNFKLTFQSLEESKIKPPKQIGVNDVSRTGVYGNTYINKEYSCSLFMPDGWKMDDNTNSKNVLVFMTKEKKEIGAKFTPRVELFMKKLQASSNAKEYESNEEKNYRLKALVNKDYTKVSEKEIDLNGTKCYELVFTWKSKSKNEKDKMITIKQKQIFIVNKGNGFVITCTDIEDNFKSNMDDFSIIYSSFKIM